MHAVARMKCVQVNPSNETHHLQTQEQPAHRGGPSGVYILVCLSVCMSVCISRHTNHESGQS